MEYRVEKYVNSLPAVLVKNTVYFIKVGSGVDVYVTNDTGTIVAYPLNYSVNNEQYIFLAANFSSNTVAYSNVTGMTFNSVANGKYLVEILGAFKSAATTTGLAMSLDIPSGTVLGFSNHLASATALNASEQITDATNTVITRGVRAANTNTVLEGQFLVSIGVTGGAVNLTLRSEIAASAVTLQAGMLMMIKKIG